MTKPYSMATYLSGCVPVRGRVSVAVVGVVCSVWECLGIVGCLGMQLIIIYAIIIYRSFVWGPDVVGSVC